MSLQNPEILRAMGEVAPEIFWRLLSEWRTRSRWAKGRYLTSSVESQVLPSGAIETNIYYGPNVPYEKARNTILPESGIVGYLCTHSEHGVRYFALNLDHSHAKSRKKAE
jgi:hypothetical protein